MQGDPPKILEDFSWTTKDGVWMTNPYEGTLSFIPPEDPRKMRVWGQDPRPEIVTYSGDSAKARLREIKRLREEEEKSLPERKG